MAKSMDTRMQKQFETKSLPTLTFSLNRSELMRHRSMYEDEPSTVPLIVYDVLRSSGKPLDQSTRSFMESKFNHDFGNVQIHNDSKAAESAKGINAKAYTLGKQIVFNRGEYLPNTISGIRLLTHELAHVIQQSGVNNSLKQNLSLGQPADMYEQKADRVTRVISQDEDIKSVYGERATSSNLVLTKTFLGRIGNSPVIQRNLEGGIIGGGIGGFLGGLTGLLIGGPTGAIIGAGLGIAAGALIGHVLSSKCALTRFNASNFVGDQVIADVEFVNALNHINGFATNRGVRVNVTDSFRPGGVPVRGAIIPPARRSNHLAGHAIDMNVIHGGQNYNSVMLQPNNLANLPAPVNSFINDIRNAADLRWGGDFGRTDPVHIDDHLNANMVNWRTRFNETQAAWQTQCFT